MEVDSFGSALELCCLVLPGQALWCLKYGTTQVVMPQIWPCPCLRRACYVLGKDLAGLPPLSHARKAELDQMSVRQLQESITQSTAVKARGRSMYRGVSMQGQKWSARARISGQYKGLGTYSTEEEAARAYDRAVVAEKGRYANVETADTSLAFDYLLGSTHHDRGTGVYKHKAMPHDMHRTCRLLIVRYYTLGSVFRPSMFRSSAPSFPLNSSLVN